MTVTYSKWSEVPAEVRAVQKYKGWFWDYDSVGAVTTTCVTKWSSPPSKDQAEAIIDTSQTVEGVTITPELTYHSECWEGGAVWFHFHPIEGSENGESSQTSGSPQV